MAASSASCGCAPSTSTRRSTTKAGTALMPAWCAMDVAASTACAYARSSSAASTLAGSSPTSAAMARSSSGSPMSRLCSQYASMVARWKAGCRPWSRAASASSSASRLLGTTSGLGR